MVQVQCQFNLFFAVVYWKEYMFMYGMVITYNKSKDQSGRVANSARGQLKRESEKSPVPVRA